MQDTLIVHPLIDPRLLPKNHKEEASAVADYDELVTDPRRDPPVPSIGPGP